MDRMMTSRERVLAAVHGLPVDRTPLFLWLNPHTTCRLLAEYAPGKNHMAAVLGKAIWRRFIRRGAMDADAWSRILPLIMEEYGNGEYALALGSDIAVLSPDFISPVSFARSIHCAHGKITVQGPFGGTMALASIYMHPLLPAVASPIELASLPLPQVTSRHFDKVRQFKDKHSDACLMVEIGAMQQVLSDYILGSENFMLALYDFPREIQEFMQRLGAWLEGIIHLAAGSGADIIFLQDDYGGNRRPLISMKMWEEITYPQLARLVSASHSHSLPFMLHSCGYQMPFLEKYVEAGVDILQSLQSGAGNDLAAAYEMTEGKLAFATGIDVQLSEGMSVDELRQSITENYDIGCSNGRFILATTHMLQHTLPDEKMKVLFNTILWLQRGALQTAQDH